MQVGDLVKLKTDGGIEPSLWGIGFLTEHNPTLGCWWVYWSELELRRFVREDLLKKIKAVKKCP